MGFLPSQILITACHHETRNNKVIELGQSLIDKSIDFTARVVMQPWSVNIHSQYQGWDNLKIL